MAVPWFRVVACSAYIRIRQIPANVTNTPPLLLVENLDASVPRSRAATQSHAHGACLRKRHREKSEYGDHSLLRVRHTDAAPEVFTATRRVHGSAACAKNCYLPLAMCEGQHARCMRYNCTQIRGGADHVNFISIDACSATHTQNLQKLYVNIVLHLRQTTSHMHKPRQRNNKS